MTEIQTFLTGGGELGALMRSHDWASTSLGAPEGWPQSLKTAVRIMLTSRQPIWIGWGKELVYLYNDPYKSIIGGKHPRALGQPTRLVWEEIWSDIEPLLATAMQGDEGTYVEEQLLIMERNGYPEETYYTFSYSPIPADDGTAGGIICANTDDTQRVIGERQISLLRDLAARTVDAKTVEDACQRTAAALTTNDRDIPFGLIYLADREGGFRLAGHTMSVPAGADWAPEVIDSNRKIRWPLSESYRDHVLRIAEAGAIAEHSTLPAGSWNQPPSQVAIIPIPGAGEKGSAGVLVLGLNPFRLLDKGYEGFFSLIAGQIGTAIAHAEAYAEERRRAEALAEIDRAKTAFFSNVSHEFRTPLTLMLGPLEDAIAEADAFSPKNRERLDVAFRNSRRLLRLVNSLLDFSRIEAGRIQAVYRPTDLGAYTEELASSFRAATERSGLQLTVEIPSLPEPAYVDQEMWEKIVLNLLSNAFKFTFDGEIAVRLSLADGKFRLTVSDTGIGIPEDELPRLFERFHRVEGARGRSFEGSGIGLALVAELVHLHGGDIRVESTEGTGTKFLIDIPIGSSHLPDDRVQEVAGDVASGQPTPNAHSFVDEALRWLPGQNDFEGGSGEIVRDVAMDGPSGERPVSGISTNETKLD